MDQPGLPGLEAQPAPPPWASGPPFVPLTSISMDQPPPWASGPPFVPLVQEPMQQYPPGAPLLQFPLGLGGGLPLPLAGGGLLARRRAADAQRRAAEGGAGGRPVPEDEVALAAREGRIEVVREWLEAGGSPHATKLNGEAAGTTLLANACMTCRPACAPVAELLCAAGARIEEGVLGRAAGVGAVDTVRVLLRYGASAGRPLGSGDTALHRAVLTNDWSRLTDPWSIANAQGATSMGHQGTVRLLLKHGAAVNARSTRGGVTPLLMAAAMAGYVSLGVVRELLAAGADLDLVDSGGDNAEAIVHGKLDNDVANDCGIPAFPELCRRTGAVEAFQALLADVRAAGSWKRYVAAPRKHLIVLRCLCAAGRASPPPVLARLFPGPEATEAPPLPRELAWKILEFWRTDRDPPPC